MRVTKVDIAPLIGTLFLAMKIQNFLILSERPGISVNKIPPTLKTCNRLALGNRGHKTISDSSLELIFDYVISVASSSYHKEM